MNHGERCSLLHVSLLFLNAQPGLPMALPLRPVQLQSCCWELAIECCHLLGAVEPCARPGQEGLGKALPREQKPAHKPHCPQGPVLVSLSPRIDLLNSPLSLCPGCVGDSTAPLCHLSARLQGEKQEEEVLSASPHFRQGLLISSQGQSSRR